jgi:hypothetical protein
MIEKAKTRRIMTNFLTLIKGLFKPKLKKKPLQSAPFNLERKHQNQLKALETQLDNIPVKQQNSRNLALNHKHYKKLIKKFTKQALVSQRSRTIERKQL